MGAVKSCCQDSKNEKLMVTKMDLSHCGCLELPSIVFNAERCIETLILTSNQISSLPPQLFHCQEMKHLNLIDNCLSSIPPAIGSFQHLVSLKLDKNNLLELPENLKMCKKLKRLSLNSNPWKQMPVVVTQLINLEELYLNECELNYLPASVGRLSKLKIIELRNNNLCNLPLSMARLEFLSRLDISDNEFTEFPMCIPKLKNLKELLLDNNDLEEIIDIKYLVQLEHLDVSYNRLTVISETIGCCVHLSMLNLSFNYLEQLPDSIGNITHLQTLHLEMNELTEIPKSIGNLTNLEELNICNNKLYSLPSTIGLLRNLRNLNVSRNIIAEFPPEIGSCTKLSIINAAYNRLQVLPSEIGYLNNLKVLDLVGNFLMYLPITIIKLQGVRAIWLSANQNIPLIPFTEDLNTANGERFLTNIALPQLGEILVLNNESKNKKIEHNEKTASWNKKIRFAEDEDILPGKLHRTPTPFPKELKLPNRKQIRNQEPRPNGNYANIIDGKVNDFEISALQPPSALECKTYSGFLNISDGHTTKIKEANIRRNKDNISESLSCDNYSSNRNENSDFDHDTKVNEQCNVHINAYEEHQSYEKQVITDKTNSEKIMPSENSMPPLPPPRINKTSNENDCDKDSEMYSRKNDAQDYGKQIIYSNLTNSSNLENSKRLEEANIKMDLQKIRTLYHNDVIYGSVKNCELSDSQKNSDNNELLSTFTSTNNENYETSFKRTASINSNNGQYKNIYSTLPPLSNQSYDLKKSQFISGNDAKFFLEREKVKTKQDLVSLANQMKSRNISPPCYEVAKMYSTKAALFEQKRNDQLKTS